MHLPKSIYVFFVALITCGFLSSLPAQARNNTLDGLEAMYIYSDDGKNTFLGCLNCSTRASNSILNYASVYYSEIKTNSIYNLRGKYGNPNSEYSVTNPQATNPPLLIGKDSKKVYGKLSLGEQGFKSPTTATIYQILQNQLAKRNLDTPPAVNY
ncbi:hypothetical protein [Psittacicella gerlachiana]|uniref:Uncharacterized protein n=1 Tax=Psittacicella gerlachiana TaxID=2028574 RepID=A0A3A1YET4_9GAMM|nr:hypothetical protein [Psittacicella gerlachiana]RIY34724.1 hypothetical protein CKF59_04985 [Psittacicella gerlachiana]